MFLIISLILISGGLLVIFAAKTAPEGEQDKEGFHVIKKP
jgi:hypothetical protein